MTIYSWNMLFSNQELNRSFRFIRDSAWDIFCLQEVPAAFVAQLKTLSVELAIADEVDRASHTTSGRITTYSIILSRHPIEASRPIPMPYHDPDAILRRRLFTGLLGRLGLWTRGLGNRHALSVDIKTPHSVVRVFNLHLSLLYPAIRLAEFELAMLERNPARPTIVCGDFNVLEAPHITPLNLALGGTLGDMLFYTRERTHIERRFFAHELTNPLCGKSTHPLSQSQLDHILVSRSFFIQHAEVITDRHGSDHHPIRVEVT